VDLEELDLEDTYSIITTAQPTLGPAVAVAKRVEVAKRKMKSSSENESFYGDDIIITTAAPTLGPGFDSYFNTSNMTKDNMSRTWFGQIRATRQI
jgi:hypothetical protein